MWREGRGRTVFRIILSSVLLSLTVNLTSSLISFQVFVCLVTWGKCKVDLVTLFQTCAELNQDVKSGCGLNHSKYNIFFHSSLFSAYFGLCWQILHAFCACLFCTVVWKKVWLMFRPDLMIWVWGFFPLSQQQQSRVRTGLGYIITCKNKLVQSLFWGGTACCSLICLWILIYHSF